jgi:hypothetical protein
VALAKIGRSISTRLATGERCYTKHHLQALLRDCEVGVLQPDVIHVGGILEAKKIAAIADASYTPVSFHNPFGPVATSRASASAPFRSRPPRPILSTRTPSCRCGARTGASAFEVALPCFALERYQLRGCSPSNRLSCRR